MAAPIAAPLPPPVTAPITAPIAAPMPVRVAVRDVWLSSSATLPSFSTRSVSPSGVRTLSMTPSKSVRPAVPEADAIEVEGHVGAPGHLARAIHAEQPAVDPRALVLRRRHHRQRERILGARLTRAQTLVERRQNRRAVRDVVAPKARRAGAAVTRLRIPVVTSGEAAIHVQAASVETRS